MDIQIPKNLLLANDIPDEYKIVYGLLAYFTYKNGYCWHSNNSLTKETGRSLSAIQRALRKLEEENYITVLHNIKKDNDLYEDNRSFKRVIWIREKYLKAKDDLRHKRKKKQLENKKMTLDEFKAFTAQTYREFDAFFTIHEVWGDVKYGINKEGELYSCYFEGFGVQKEFLNEAKQNQIWTMLYNNNKSLKLTNEATGA